MLENCLFCKKQKGWVRGKGLIYQNSEAFSILSATPAVPGHAIVIPFRHTESPERLIGITEFWRAIPETFHALGAKYLKEADWLEKYYARLRGNTPSVKHSAELIAEMLEHPMLKVSPVAYNFFANNGKEAGQTISHMHVHIIPRREGENNRGGGIAFKKMLSPSALDSYL